MADLFTTARALPANRLAEHQVRTLPSLIHALHSLMKVAADRRCAAVNLADVDPLHGATVSLNVDNRGLLNIQIEGLTS